MIEGNATAKEPGFCGALSNATSTGLSFEEFIPKINHSLAGDEQRTTIITSCGQQVEKEVGRSGKCMDDFPLKRREWHILSVLWEFGEATADEIFSRFNLTPRGKRNYMKSLLGMIDKGIVKRSETAVHRFAPCLNRMQAATLSVRAWRAVRTGTAQEQPESQDPSSLVDSR